MRPESIQDSLKPLRIAQTCSDFGLGGIARHAFDLSAWLKARGHDLYLAGTPDEWAGEWAEDRFLPIPTRYVGGARRVRAHFAAISLQVPDRQQAAGTMCGRRAARLLGCEALRARRPSSSAL